MKTLYVDNYKGFMNTFISFQNVNFFVGNNSTGKSAILNLLTLVMDRNFWNNPSFNTDVMEMGYFDEIVNHYSSNKSYFSIGLEFNGIGAPIYYEMKFEPKNNIPTLCEYMQSNDDKSLKLRFEKGKVIYSTRSSSQESFEEWILHADDFEEEKELEGFSSSNYEMPLISLLAIWGDDMFGGNNSKNFFFHNPITHVLYDNYKGFAPIRAKAHRNYDAFKQSFSSEGDHIPVKLRNIFSSLNQNKYKSIRSKLNKFGEVSGLFDKLEVVEFKHKGSSPYSIDVVYDKHPVNITNVGYGVSQILPIVVEMVTNSNATFSIQQPEVHLHPKAQAEFGELLFTSATENKNVFFVETHSDYTINRFRYRLNKSKRKLTGQILFFERDKNGLKVTPLLLDNNGKFREDPPESYSDFFVDEELKMLEF